MSGVKIIGGVAFQAEEIVKAYENPENNKFTVEMKDGTVIIYPAQAYEQEAEVRRTPEGRIDFRGLYNAVIIDTPKDDVYRLMGCKNVIMNGDTSDDSDFIEVIDRRLSTGEIQISENNRICLNKNDFYIGTDAENISYMNNDTDIDV